MNSKSTTSSSKSGATISNRGTSSQGQKEKLVTSTADKNVKATDNKSKLLFT